MKKYLQKIFFTLIFSLFVFYGPTLRAANVSDYLSFKVDKNFEANERAEISSVLVKTSPSIYFYVDKSWWDLQVQAKKNEILANLDNLSFEFSNKIYPTLTSVFGYEWNPGVDGDNKITILFHQMKDGAAGYFRSSDGYIKIQVPDSNEREMIYISVNNIDSLQLKAFVAHEFVHLITFNQKDRINNVQEEVWFNEARAEYSLNILGYNNPYDGSSLQKRMKDFLSSPSDALTEWQGTRYDYGVVNIFMGYLVDHYGISVLSDSIKLKSVGIESINQILLRDGAKEDFSQIFTNWTVALLVNNCSLDLKHCYLNQDLKNLRINPTINFLPLSGNSSLSVTNVTKNWSGNWQKIIGGNGNLKLEFESLPSLSFKVPYALFDKNNNYSIDFFVLDANEKGKIEIKDFGTKYSSLVIMPSLQTKISGFNGFEFTYPYTFTVSITGEVSSDEAVIIQQLLLQIESLKKQIAALQTGSTSSNSGQGQNNFCSSINNNLYVGVLNRDEVMCLQQFLKSQGSDVYPQALVTGNFLGLTKTAVARFQEKYKNEILTPLGLLQGTGFVGSLTRNKINQLLQSS